MRRVVLRLQRCPAMLTRTHGLALSLFLSSLTAGCTSIGGAASSTEQPIIGGTTNTGDPGVVLLRAMQGSGANGYSICTAEIVSPHVVMTAAHCVDPATVGSGNTFDVFIGSNLNGAEGNDASKWLSVKETHYNTNFDPNQL